MHCRAAIAFLLFSPSVAFAQKALPPPFPPNPPPPVFRPALQRADERPVAVETKRDVVADNGLYRRVETTITFTNPNGRVFEGELEFPLPDGAAVCGYALEVNGVMTPGVVCEKEKARVAFDNEKRKGVDPGVVEHVKGNLWKTRIYPLMPGTPRKAKIAYVEPLDGPAGATATERDGDHVFVAVRGAAEAPAVSPADKLRAAKTGWILWDASFSRHGKTAADRNLLECLPAEGEWTLVTFRDVPEAPRKFTSRAELLKAVDAAPCDGGTSFAALAAVLPKDGAKFLFSDEVDTLSAKAPEFELDPAFVFASRPAAAKRAVSVKRLGKDAPEYEKAKEGTLLATAWAANRIADLSAQADARKEEFLALGRRYGVASPVTSLIVLESLSQYLEHKIEPPADSPFHAEWAKARAAEDDAIAAARAAAEHKQSLLRYWEERVKWWNDPIPPKRTPSSGLFARAEARSAAVADLSAAVAELSAEEDGLVAFDAPRSMAPRAQSAEAADGAVFSVRGNRYLSSGAKAKRAVAAPCAAKPLPPEPRGPSATVTIAAWDPKTPYLDALAGAADAYAEYLRQRDVHGASPAFHLDCAGWFFKKGMRAIALRVISNLAEMKLEDVGMWRTMGWRLREAAAYDEAIAAFRHVLAQRGEEPQSRRDLALVLTEAGKSKFDKALLAEAALLLNEAAFTPAPRRSGRRGNDMQTSVLALEELNGLFAWCAANEKRMGAFRPVTLEPAFRRDLPLDLRIVMSWDVDETDVDLHVLEPDGEEAYYGHRRTGSGGFVSEDVTTGYGPEEYLKKKAEKGTYKVLANYFASHQQKLYGAAVVTATVYTGWGTKDEKRQVLSFRLDKARDKHPVGEIEVD